MGRDISEYKVGEIYGSTASTSLEDKDKEFELTISLDMKSVSSE